LEEVFLYEAGEDPPITLISADESGDAANAASSSPSLAAGQGYLGFESAADNLNGSPDHEQNVYLAHLYEEGGSGNIDDPPPGAPQPSCTDAIGKYNTLATNGTQTGNHQGVKATTWFGKWEKMDCQRVSSVSVFRSASRLVEWGWSLGWLFGEDQLGPCGPKSHYYKLPRNFAVWSTAIGGTHCTVEGYSSAKQWYDMALKDGDSDTVWSYFQGPFLLGSMPTDFDRGNIRTNAERHNDGDSAWSVFKSLQFQVSGSGNTWFPFVDLKPVAPNAVGDDPVYNCIRVSDQEERVSADPRTC